jgi:glycosyltransferase involved in cell wall biosynthesis
MVSSKYIFKSTDLAILVPTKDRPNKIQNLLNSLKAQTVSCGRIIIVDGGQSVGSIVISYTGHLPVEYYEVYPPGQIRQRNKAISLLDSRTSLAAFLDDDIILEPNAIESVILFWNNCEPETAGVSFNIVNNPPFKHSWLKSLIGMSSPEQGKILTSGYNVAISPVNKNIRAQWLCGGATVWRKEILDTFINKEVFSKWAICEDVNFSYPIGKQYPLYVCSDAKVRHEHVFDHKTKMKYLYYGKTVTLWRLYFVESNPELSRISFFWMLLWQIFARFFMGLFLLRLKDIQYGFGQIEGAVIGLTALFRKSGLLNILNENQDN